MLVCSAMSSMNSMMVLISWGGHGKNSVMNPLQQRKLGGDSIGLLATTVRGSAAALSGL